LKEIREFQNILPQRICKKLIRYFDEIGPETSNGVSVNNSQLDALNLSNELEKEIKPLIELCLEPYREDNQICEEPLTYRASRVVKYDPGSECGLHYDSELLETEPGIYKPRPVNVVTFLNTDYKGGFLVFPFQDKLFEPNLGSIVVFPTSFPYKHTVTRVSGNPRYILVSSVIRNKIKMY
jgi:hypothetical protein